MDKKGIKVKNREYYELNNDKTIQLKQILKYCERQGGHLWMLTMMKQLISNHFSQPEQLQNLRGTHRTTAALESRQDTLEWLERDYREKGKTLR